MSRATKIYSSHTEPDKEVPDWTNREKSLKRIDWLAGIEEQSIQAQQTNVYIQAQKSADKFIVK